MKSHFIIQFLLIIISTQLYGQKESGTIDFIDIKWTYTHADTIQELDGFIINYYDSLCVDNENFEKHFVGQDDLDSLMNFRRKQRVLQTGLSYAIDYSNGKPIAGGYGNGNSIGSRTTYLQWHENGELQLIVNYLIIELLEGVKDGLSIWFDETGKLEGYELYSSGKVIFKSK